LPPHPLPPTTPPPPPSLSTLTAASVGGTVLIRARLFILRETGKMLFLTLRQGSCTVQAVVHKSEDKDMFKWATSLPRESVLDVTAKVGAVEKRVESVTQGEVELVVSSLFVVSKAHPVLPFLLEHASLSDTVYAEQDAAEAAAAAAGQPPPTRLLPSVSPDLRLDHRWMDLRTPANQAIMRISSGVCQLFREFLLSKDFVEIQTPKILGGASEGGSSVFTLKYFGDDACLAQSPQLYKQMAAACSDLERVFEIGPVFRAENSNTHRHLCEFHGLDMEMAISEHYFEVLDVFSDMFIYIFDGLNSRYRAELEAVRAQHPFEDLRYTRPSLRITYAEGVQMLQDAGVAFTSGDDFSTAQEKALGAIVKEKYGTDFFMMDRYPSSIRPFYTMPCPDDPTLSNSYDFFIRGEEIVSGAQRIHDADMLAASVSALQHKGAEPARSPSPPRPLSRNTHTHMHTPCPPCCPPHPLSG
jgi:nondiscriminating aspartyl-tRNA synthetase